MVGLRRRCWIAGTAALFLVAGGTQAALAQSAGLYNDQERSETIRVGMQVLGGWALGNMAVSGPLYFSAQDEIRHFHEMNVAWNAVNLAIAGTGLIVNSRARPSSNLAEALTAQRKIESTLLLNIGLDVGYMAAGWALLERSERDVPETDRWKGYGASLIMQGGFLLLFDLGFYLFQRQNRPDITRHACEGLAEFRVAAAECLRHSA